MREPADDGVAWDAFAATASTPLVRLDDPAGEHRTVWLEPLPGDFEAELIKSTEARQVRACEVRGSGSVRHVEVFRMGGVGTSIFGRPRRLPGDRRATRLYTLNWEEPLYTLICESRFDGAAVPEEALAALRT